MLLRHPSEYKLIAKEDSNWNHPTQGHRFLMRLAPEFKVPRGYIEISNLRGKGVYDEDGRLNHEFMALVRYRSDGRYRAFTHVETFEHLIKNQDDTKIKMILLNELVPDHIKEELMRRYNSHITSHNNCIMPRG